MDNARKLTSLEIEKVADRLASVATEAGIQAAAIALELGLRVADLNFAGASAAVWLTIVRAVHAGASPDAGFGSDSVARLVQTVGSHVPGNQELSELANKIGSGLATRPGTRSIFLSYAHADRDDVDRLYDALRKEHPQTEVFQDYRSLSAGQDWLAVLRQRAGSSDLTVCWVTSAFLESTFTPYEVGIADSRGATIVPIFAEPGISRKAPTYLSTREGLAAESAPDFPALAKALHTAVQNQATSPLAKVLSPLQNLSRFLGSALGKSRAMGKVMQDPDFARIAALLTLCGLTLWLFPSPKAAFISSLIVISSLFILPLLHVTRNKGRFFEKFLKNLLLFAIISLFILIMLLVITEQFPGGQNRLRSWAIALGLISTEIQSRRPSIIVLPFSGPTAEGLLTAQSSVLDDISPRLAIQLDQDPPQDKSLLRVLPESLSQLLLEALPLAPGHCLRRELLEQVYLFTGANFVVNGRYEMKDENKTLVNICLQRTSDLHSTDEVQIRAENLAGALAKATESIREYIGIPEVQDIESGERYSSPLAMSLYLQGLRSRNRFELAKARDFFAESTEEDPDFLLAESALARTLYELGRDIEARSVAKDILTHLESDPPTIRHLRHAMLARANAYSILHQWKKSISVYTQLVELYRDYVEYGLLLIRAQSLSGRGKDAIAEIQQIEKLEASKEIAVSPIERVLLEIERANAWLVVGNFREQNSAAQRASTLASRVTDGLLLVRARFFECAAQVYLGAEWEHICSEVESRFENLSDATNLGKVYGSIGNGLAHREEYERAEDYYNKALEIFKTLSFYRGQVDQLLNLSMTVEEEEEAEIFCQSALSISERYGTMNRDAAKLNCAYFPAMQGKFGEAKRMYREALQSFREMGAELDEAIALGNIGYMNHALGLRSEPKQHYMAEAKKYYFKSISLSCELGEAENEMKEKLTENGFADTLIRFARLYADLEQEEEARRLFVVAAQMVKKSQRQSWLDDLIAEIDQVLLPSYGDAWYEMISSPIAVDDSSLHGFEQFCETLTSTQDPQKHHSHLQEREMICVGCVDSLAALL